MIIKWTPAFAGLTLFLFSSVSHAAVYYVRQNSPGGCSTSDPSACNWNNAYPSLPATLERGATYYVAGGTYGSYTVNTPVNGNLVITIKKQPFRNTGRTPDGFLLMGPPKPHLTTIYFFEGPDASFLMEPSEMKTIGLTELLMDSGFITTGETISLKSANMRQGRPPAI